MAALLAEIAPRVQALADAQRLDVDALAKEVGTIARAVQAIGDSFTEFASKSYSDIEGQSQRIDGQALRTATIAAAVEHLTKRLNETRRTVNAVSGPRVPDLADVSGMHSVTALVRADLTAELAKRDAAAAEGKLAKVDAAARESRAKAWDVFKFVIGAVIGILLAYAAGRLGLK